MGTSAKTEEERKESLDKRIDLLETLVKNMSKTLERLEAKLEDS